MSQDQSSEALDVFVSYAHEDEDLQDELRKHLTSLEREGKIRAWHDRGIKAGEEWGGKIDFHLDASEIILLLISPDFMASNYCSAVEVPRAMQRHQQGATRVIPIIVRPVDWSGAAFAKLQVLPEDATPVTLWPNRDMAFLNVQQGLRSVIETEIRRRRGRRRDPLPVDPPAVRADTLIESGGAGKKPDPGVIKLDRTVESTRQSSGRQRSRLVMAAVAVAILVAIGLASGLFNEQPVVESPSRGFIEQASDYTNVTIPGRNPTKNDVLLITGDVIVYSNTRNRKESGRWRKDTEVRVRDRNQGNAKGGVWLECEKVEKNR